MELTREEAEVLAIVMITDLLKQNQTELLQKIGLKRIREFVSFVNSNEVSLTTIEQEDFVANIIDKLLRKVDI